MIFVTGPLFAGKKEYIRTALGWTEEELAQRAVWDVQDLAPEAENLEALAQSLGRHPVVIATEVGGGVVPVSPDQRQGREGPRPAWPPAGPAGGDCGAGVLRPAQVLKGELP